MPSSEIVIAGGGLAGACAAFCLSRAGHAVRLLEANVPGAGASGAAAGSVNPFMARKAHPTWRLDEALEALCWIVDEAGAEKTFAQRGVLRPARSAKQAGFFQDAATEHPGRTAWLAPAPAAEQFPAVRSPHGALWIPDGGAADVPALIARLLEATRQNGGRVETGVRVTNWETHPGSVAVATEREGAVQIIEARRLLLCVGQGAGALPALARLDLRPVKGQTLRLRRPAALRGTPLPSLSGHGYVVAPPGTDALLAGSTYEHDFADLAPTAEGRARILEKVRQMLPALADADVLGARAGVRVSPPGSPLPAVGPLPEHGQRKHLGSRRGNASSSVWVFTALGSRGLLTAPLLARALPSFLEAPSRIPQVVRACTA